MKMAIFLFLTFIFLFFTSFIGYKNTLLLIMCLLILSTTGIWYFYKNKRENSFQTYELVCEDRIKDGVALALFYNDKSSYACTNFYSYKNIATSCKPTVFDIRESYEGYLVGNLFTNKENSIKVTPTSISGPDGKSFKCHLRKGSTKESLPKVVEKLKPWEMDWNVKPQNS